MAIEIPWKSTKDGFPEKTGKKSYEHVECLVITMHNAMSILQWNCEEECWDDESGDDFALEKDEVAYYIPTSEIQKPQP